LEYSVKRGELKQFVVFFGCNWFVLGYREGLQSSNRVVYAGYFDELNLSM